MAEPVRLAGQSVAPVGEGMTSARVTARVGGPSSKGALAALDGVVASTSLVLLAGRGEEALRRAGVAVAAEQEQVVDLAGVAGKAVPTEAVKGGPSVLGMAVPKSTTSSGRRASGGPSVALREGVDGPQHRVGLGVPAVVASGRAPGVAVRGVASVATPRASAVSPDELAVTVEAVAGRATVAARSTALDGPRSVAVAAASAVTGAMERPASA